jgi:uncharacterized tellurite resistance protein B-like protein
MFSWFKRKDSGANREQAKLLYAKVAEVLDGRDEVHVRIVSCIAALLVCVAYADMDYSAEEEAVLRQTLARIQGLDARGVNAILTVLREHTVIIASAESSTYAREILELTEIDFRLELLDALVDLAAADDEITVAETNMMRSIAKALGLTQKQYNAAQARHRDKLAVLK